MFPRQCTLPGKTQQSLSRSLPAFPFLQCFSQPPPILPRQRTVPRVAQHPLLRPRSAVRRLERLRQPPPVVPRQRPLHSTGQLSLPRSHILLPPLPLGYESRRWPPAPQGQGLGRREVPPRIVPRQRRRNALSRRCLSRLHRLGRHLAHRRPHRLLKDRYLEARLFLSVDPNSPISPRSWTAGLRPLGQRGIAHMPTGTRFAGICSSWQSTWHLRRRYPGSGGRSVVYVFCPAYERSWSAPWSVFKSHVSGSIARRLVLQNRVERSKIEKHRKIE